MDKDRMKQYIREFAKTTEKYADAEIAYIAGVAQGIALAKKNGYGNHSPAA